MQKILKTYLDILNKQIIVVNSELTDGFDSSSDSVNYILSFYKFYSFYLT